MDIIKQKYVAKIVAVLYLQAVLVGCASNRAVSPTPVSQTGIVLPCRAGYAIGFVPSGENAGIVLLREPEVRLNKQFELVDRDGDSLVYPLSVPLDCKAIKITSVGRVSIVDGNGNEVDVGQIAAWHVPVFAPTRRDENIAPAEAEAAFLSSPIEFAILRSAGGNPKVQLSKGNKQ